MLREGLQYDGGVKRWALRIFVLLLLGAIVNVAVAWGCAMWSQPPFSVRLKDFGDEMVWWQQNAPAQFPTQADEFLCAESWGTSYVGMMALNRQISAMSYEANRWQSGWPTRTLERSMWTNRDQGALWLRHSLVVDHSNRPSRILPLRPIWPGFAINTLFYAVMLWGLLVAPFALRRRRRIKRGLCPACAYPVGESEVCTECGAPLTAQPKMPGAA